MANAAEPNDVPRGRWDFKEAQHWIVVTARGVGSDEPATVEMTLDQWYKLPPVQYVVRLQLSRQQPRRPRAATHDPGVVHNIPHASIEWKDGQNWVILTAYRAGSREVTSVEMTLGQWIAFGPVQSIVEERLERWEENKLLQRGAWTLGPHQG
jgi:hypothetical protein